jgi:ankyrin repeat protein
MNLGEDEIKEIQDRYSHLINYQSNDVHDSIDPLKYLDSNGDSLLHIASSAGDKRTVELLLDAGFDVNQLGDMGCTALHYARKRGKKEICELLLKYQASEEIINEFGNKP